MIQLAGEVVVNAGGHCYAVDLSYRKAVDASGIKAATRPQAHGGRQRHGGYLEEVVRYHELPLLSLQNCPGDAAHPPDGLGELQPNRRCNDLATGDREVRANVAETRRLELLLLIQGVIVAEPNDLECTGAD